MWAIERMLLLLSGMGWRKDTGFQQDSSGHIGREAREEDTYSPGEKFQP